MKRKIRPLSPHLLIYKPQLTSIFSIFHRISAFFLFVCLILFLILLYGNDFYLSFFVFYLFYYYYFSFFKILFYFFSYFLFFIFLFHMINGLRHLSWDFGFGLQIKNVYTTGIFVFFLSFLIAIIFILI